MSQGVESEAGESGGERAYRDQTAASTLGHPNSSETASSKRGVTRNLSNRRPPPTTNDTKRQNATLQTHGITGPTGHYTCTWLNVYVTIAQDLIIFTSIYAL
jgi:hypothetical protein